MFVDDVVVKVADREERSGVQKPNAIGKTYLQSVTV